MDNTDSETNQDSRLSAQSGLFSRQTAGHKSVVQITAKGRNGSIIQGKYRTQSMV